MRFYLAVLIVVSPLLISAGANKKLIFKTSGEFKSTELYDAMGIKLRPWYKFWKDKTPRINQKVIPTIEESLDGFYKSEGFYNASIKKSESNDSVIFTIDENLPVMVKDINISGDSSIEDIISLKSGERFRAVEFSKIKKEIKNSMLEKGYCNYQLDSKARVDIVKNEALVFYKLDKNSPCYFGDITIDGPSNIRNKIVLSRLNFHKGDRYDIGKVNRSYSTISGLEAFDAINIDLDKNGNIVDVKVYLREKEKKTKIELGVGYETNIGPRGIFRWERRNFAGNAKKVSMDFKFSNREKYAKNSIYWPAFIKAPVGDNYYLDLKNSFLYSDSKFLDFTEKKFSNYLHFLKDYNILSVDFGVGVERISISSSSDKSTLSSGDFNLFFPFGKISLDLRDSKINPKNGIYLSQYLEGGVELFQDSSTYLKSISEARFIYTIGLFTFATKGKLGLIQEYAKHLPASKLFFAGGSFSNRGYSYNSLGAYDTKDSRIGGRTLIDTTLEVSHPIYKKFDGALFFDSTLLSQDNYRFSIDFVHSIGAGIRYISPIGPIKFDIGVDIDRGSQYAMHFQIGQSF